MYKIRINILLSLILLLVSSLLAQGQTATGIGYGLTKDAAVEQAKRDAVEQGLGAYMTSTTTVTATSIEDNIYSKAQGFVKSFKIIKENRFRFAKTVNLASFATLSSFSFHPYHRGRTQTIYPKGQHWSRNYN